MERDRDFPTNGRIIATEIALPIVAAFNHISCVTRTHPSFVSSTVHITSDIRRNKMVMFIAIHRELWSIREIRSSEAIFAMHIFQHSLRQAQRERERGINAESMYIIHTSYV